MTNDTKKVALAKVDQERKKSCRNLFNINVYFLGTINE